MPTLPPYKGHYSVGFTDIETLSTAKSPGLLARIFYPSLQKPSTSSWLPLKWKYSKGYGQFLSIPLFFIAMVVYPTLSFTFARFGLELSLASDQKKFPVVIFSHGLGGMRTTYSQLCGNLASRGFIVVSIEHGDGSACYTSRMDGKLEIPYYIPRKEDLEDDESTQEYLFRLRQKQVNQRRDEVVECVSRVKDLNEGNLECFLEQEQTYKEFRGAFDFENMIMVGHSFGAATAINVLTSTDVKFNCAVLLDPWMFSLGKDLKLTIPTLNMQSNIFHWTENLESIKKMVYNPSYSTKSIFGYLKDTRHQDASDLGLFFPWLMRMAKQSGPQDPQVTHLAQDQLIYDFVKKHAKVVTSASEGVSFDYEKLCVFGEQAFRDLFATAKKEY